MTEIIGTDHPLEETERKVLSVLLDTLLPPSDDGVMPGAGQMDLLAFMDNPLNAEFVRVVQEATAWLGEEFASLDADQRVQRVSAFNTGNPEAFSQIYMQALAVYYRQDAVLRAIGSREGPPFPRGNDVADGDMSLLDPVIGNAKGYRPA